MLALTVSEILTFKMFDREDLDQVTEYNIRRGPIRWQISMSKQIIICIFALALTLQRY